MANTPAAIVFFVIIGLLGLIEFIGLRVFIFVGVVFI